MKKFKIIKEFQSAFGNLFPVGTIVLADLTKSVHYVHFGEASEIESGLPAVIGTNKQNFLDHVEDCDEEAFIG